MELRRGYEGEKTYIGLPENVRAEQPFKLMAARKAHLSLEVNVRRSILPSHVRAQRAHTTLHRGRRLKDREGAILLSARRLGHRHGKGGTMMPGVGQYQKRRAKQNAEEKKWRERNRS
jgi:hypothetical protein